MEDSGRIIAYLVWAFGTVAIWGGVVAKDILALRRYPRNRRSLRELLSDIPLFLVAFASGLSLLFLLAGPPLAGTRGFIVALALGGFSGAGIIRLSIGRNGA